MQEHLPGVPIQEIPKNTANTIYCRIQKSQRIFQMSNVSIFKFEKSFTVRTVVKDGEPWFVAKDICGFFSATPLDFLPK